MRIALLQLEHSGFKTLSVRGADVVVSSRRPPGIHHPVVYLDAGYVVVDDGVRKEAHPCGATIELNGARLLLVCFDVEPCMVTQRSNVDAVLVLGLVWGRKGDAKFEARRLLYRLMILSRQHEAPVLFTNLWGVEGKRVYLGYTGVYDYRKALPLHLGIIGDGYITFKL